MRLVRITRVRRLPFLCIGGSALLFVLSLGLLLNQCSAKPEPEIQPQGDVTQLEDGREVTLQLQEPQLPNGCEVTSLPMVLGWAGYPVDKLELYEGYLPRQDFTETPEGWKVGGNPEDVYVGDAASKLGGWYCSTAGWCSTL